MTHIYRSNQRLLEVLHSKETVNERGRKKAYWTVPYSSETANYIIVTVIIVYYGYIIVYYYIITVIVTVIILYIAYYIIHIIL